MALHATSNEITSNNHDSKAETNTGDLVHKDGVPEADAHWLIEIIAASCADAAPPRARYDRTAAGLLFLLLLVNRYLASFKLIYLLGNNKSI